MKEEDKDLNYWKENAKDAYTTTPICVLRYITELEKAVDYIRKPPKTKCRTFSVFFDDDCEYDINEWLSENDVVITNIQQNSNNNQLITTIFYQQ